MGFWDWLRGVLGGEARAAAAAEASPEQLEALRAGFRLRHHAFQQLLTANNRALAVMTEMESALAGDAPYGLGFVRSRATRVAAAVYRMIQQLDHIAPGRYAVLFERFREIQARLEPILAAEGDDGEGPLVIGLDQVDGRRAGLVGPKMAALGEVSGRLGLETPGGFVVTTAAHRRFLAHRDLLGEIEERIVAVDVRSAAALHGLSETIQQMVREAEVPADVADALLEAYRALRREVGDSTPLMLRSSAVHEDEPGWGTAGQYLSRFDVHEGDLLSTYKEVVASTFRVWPMSVRLRRGLTDHALAMAVGCMPVQEARAGGVVYSRNPLSDEDDSILVHSVWGIPKPVVDGVGDCDRFVVRRDPEPVITRRHVAHKPFRMAFDPGAAEHRSEPVTEGVDEPSITDEQVLRVAEMAVTLERHFGSTQDAEWVIRPDGTPVVVQTRSLTELPASPPPGPAEDLPDADHAVLLGGGSTASPGLASGPVFPVRQTDDARLLPEGAILVAAQSLPVWAMALDRAAAVVTQEGSVVGHLANVARESGVPALFGVPGALAHLRAGETVTVDADRGRVLEGVAGPSRTVHPADRIGAADGGPVADALARVLRRIVPLELVDPDAPEFRARNCRTLHDITRFCHEKAVREMFRFGVEQSFPERAARQLHADVPMQFWIIDLDDGLTDVGSGDGFVRLEQIRSIPMLALWEGMTAVPWAGPPPVDAGGFLSVLVGSTANPELVPGAPSTYAARNYFMISRDFCSLQSRFGYHLAGVEALVGDRPRESYVSFHFKGGAADRSRRERRVGLVAELLANHGFRVEVEGDALRARVERFERPAMEDRLRVLGYLIIHTRQLDMVAKRPGALEPYRSRMRADLERLVGGGND